MIFKEMSGKKIRELLDGQKDILTPLVEADMEIYRDSSCPRCGGTVQPEIDMNRVLAGNRIVPRQNCRCVDCSCLFEPFTGMIIEMGNLARIEPRIPIIRGKD